MFFPQIVLNFVSHFVLCKKSPFLPEILTLPGGYLITFHNYCSCSCTFCPVRQATVALIDLYAYELHRRRMECEHLSYLYVLRTFWYTPEVSVN